MNKYIKMGLIVFIIIVIVVMSIFKKIEGDRKYDNFPKYRDFEKAKELNPDTVGWIYIPKTNINYPIMYHYDNYYLDYGFEGEKLTSGAIYTTNNAKSQNMVITGHNSRVSVAKFYWLHNIRDVNLGLNNGCYEKNNLSLSKEVMPNFENKEDKIWYVSLYGITGKWEIFSMYETDVDESPETIYYNTWDNGYDFKDFDNIYKWINYQISRSDYDFGTIPNVNDQFLTVYTCSCQYYDEDNESRLYYFLRKIT